MSFDMRAPRGEIREVRPDSVTDGPRGEGRVKDEMASSPSALRQLPPAGTLLIAAVEVIVFINVNVGAAWYLFLPTCPLQFISDPVTSPPLRSTFCPPVDN